MSTNLRIIVKNLSMERKWYTTRALQAKWLKTDVMCAAGDDPILQRQYFQVEDDGTPAGAGWHDDCAEDAGWGPYGKRSTS